YVYVGIHLLELMKQTNECIVLQVIGDILKVSTYKPNVSNIQIKQEFSCLAQVMTQKVHNFTPVFIKRRRSAILRHAFDESKIANYFFFITHRRSPPNRCVSSGNIVVTLPLFSS